MIVVQDVTMGMLTDALDGAAIDWHSKEDGSVYAQGGQPGCWVDIVADGKLLQFLTFWPLHDGTEELAALRFANRCNDKYTMIQFDVSLERGRVYGQWHLQMSDGLNLRQFLRTLRQFCNGFAEAARDLDHDNVLTKSPVGDKDDNNAKGDT